MEIQPVGRFHSPLTTKFGLPRQSGLAPSLRGTVILEPQYRRKEAIRGIEGFSHLWLLWGFSANGSKGVEACRSEGDGVQLTVRPPRLGGNERVGVFASRSPFRPNGIGLSCVELIEVEYTGAEGPVLHVAGADLMDGTPIFDIKPYLAYADSRPDAKGGFTEQRAWQPLKVKIPEKHSGLFSTEELLGLEQVLAQDPRPQYHNDPERVYGMSFAGHDVRFVVDGDSVRVVDVC